MKRTYAVEFMRDDEVVPQYTGAEFASWQSAYQFAKSTLLTIPHGADDPIITATVTGYMPDGRSGILAEFSIPTTDGSVVRH